MERNTFNIIFYVRKNKVKTDGDASLFMRLTINGRRWDSALKIKIDPSKWDAKKQVAIEDNCEKDSNLINEIDSADITNHVNLGQTYMHLGLYRESLKYFEKYFEWVNAIGRTTSDLHRIGFVYWKTGNKDKAKYYLEKAKRVSEESIKLGRAYASMSLNAYYDLAGIYAFMGEKEKAYKNLEELKKIKVFPLWWLTLIKNDPLFDSIKDEPQFREIVNDLESKYQAEHERVRKWLEEQGEL